MEEFSVPGHQKWNIRFGEIAVNRAVNSRFGGAQGCGVPVVSVHEPQRLRPGGTHGGAGVEKNACLERVPSLTDNLALLGSLFGRLGRDRGSRSSFKLLSFT